MESSQLLEKAVALHREGAEAEAEKLYNEILSTDPSHTDTRQMLGILRMEQERFADALEEFNAILRDKPGAIQALMQKGFALRALGRKADALAHYEHILRMGPGFPPALYLRGDLLLSMGRAQEALQSFERALAEAREQFAEAWLGRSAALQQLHRLPEALASCDRAIALKPDNAEAWFYRAGVLSDMGQQEDAVASFDKAIALRPDYGRALCDRGLSLLVLKRNLDAARSFEQALALDPDAIFAFGGLAAAALYACDWDKVETLRGAVRKNVVAENAAIAPGILLGYDDDPALQHRCARAFTAHTIRNRPQPLWRGEIFRNDKIRVAYLSADFHDHATAHLIAELFERHDRNQFEIWGVAFDADDGSAMRRRLVGGFDKFVDVHDRSDLAVAQILRAGQIDIAVDLKGFTSNGRTAVFAHRPAPLQINYLGFPGTMGADFYDYILADKIVAPLDQAPFYSEKIAQLPDCYQPNDTRRQLDVPTPTRTQAGLPEQGFVFCSFNNSWKITPGIFAVWMRLLAAIPDSVFWLIADNADAETNLRRHAVSHGIAPERLIFAPRLQVELHMARHRLADLFLDTWPCNAHTTASDALRLGVPLLTLTGHTFAGRVATSLLHNVHMPELAVGDLEAYERAALDLARGGVQKARQKLAANLTTAPLFDGARFCRGIEAAYRTMWQAWQAGMPPTGFTVPPQ
jgi:predicted O-linked N-acetylglucosamine transferase (SPINDLY family)